MFWNSSVVCINAADVLPEKTGWILTGRTGAGTCATLYHFCQECHNVAINVNKKMQNTSIYFKAEDSIIKLSDFFRRDVPRSFVKISANSILTQFISHRPCRWEFKRFYSYRESMLDGSKSDRCRRLMNSITAFYPENNGMVHCRSLDIIPLCHQKGFPIPVRVP